MKKFIAIILICLFCSCSPNARLKKLINKNPQLVKNIDTKFRLKDTLYFKDTIFLPGKEINFTITDTDTIFIIGKDTVFIVGKSVKIKTPKDTIYKDKIVYLDKEIIIPGKAIEIDYTPGWIKFVSKNYLGLILIPLLILGIKKLFKNTG